MNRLNQNCGNCGTYMSGTETGCEIRDSLVAWSNEFEEEFKESENYCSLWSPKTQRECYANCWNRKEGENLCGFDEAATIMIDRDGKCESYHPIKRKNKKSTN